MPQHFVHLSGCRADGQAAGHEELGMELLPSRAAEQWKQVLREVLALPPFSLSVSSQGRLWDGLGATTHMGQKGNPCWVACPLHPRHLLELSLLCRLERTLGSQSKFRDVGEDVKCSVCSG